MNTNKICFPKHSLLLAFLFVLLGVFLFSALKLISVKNSLNSRAGYLSYACPAGSLMQKSKCSEYYKEVKSIILNGTTQYCCSADAFCKEIYGATYPGFRSSYCLSGFALNCTAPLGLTTQPCGYKGIARCCAKHSPPNDICNNIQTGGSLMDYCSHSEDLFNSDENLCLEGYTVDKKTICETTDVSNHYCCRINKR